MSYASASQGQVVQNVLIHQLDVWIAKTDSSRRIPARKTKLDSNHLK